jgi:hypothetical protein
MVYNKACCWLALASCLGANKQSLCARMRSVAQYSLQAN